MPPRRKRRIDPALFELPVERIRAGEFSDVYFNRARAALRTSERAARVTWQVSVKKAGWLGGIDEAVALLKLCADDFAALEVLALYEGDRVEPWDTVLLVEGEYASFAHLETLVLGTLGRRTRICSNVRTLVDAARPKAIYFFGARSDHAALQAGDGFSAMVGGAASVSTDAQGRFLGKPGVAGFLVTSTRNQPIHANEYMRLYAMLEEANMPIGFHAHHNWNNEYTRQLNRFMSMHALSFVLSNMVHLTNWVVNGLPERFPKLKVMWIESGLAWVPFLMQRLDHEYLMRVSEAPLLKRLPSDYMREMFYTMQPMEATNLKLLEGTFEAINASAQLLYASDWPHWDFDVPARLFDLPFLDDKSKRNILGLNAARVFNLDVPARYRNPLDVAAE